MRCALLIGTLLAASFAACGGEDAPESYDTYQECFDDHTVKEMLPIQEAIVVCCLEHPIDGQVEVCQSSVPDCVNYLTANLKQTSASPSDVQAACQEYITQKDM